MITKEQGEALSLEIQKEAVRQYRQYTYISADETAEMRLLSKIRLWMGDHEEFILGVALGLTKGGEWNKAAEVNAAIITVRRFFAATLGGEE